MRFTLIKDIKSDKTMQPILGGLLLFILAYLVGDFFVKSASIGLLYTTLSLTLLGDAEQFLDPVNEAYFLELLHAESFFLMMILLTLSAVFMRLFHKIKISFLLLHITMFTALCSIITLGFAYYFSVDFLYIYIPSFFIWHIGAICMSVFSLWRLYFDTSL